MAGSSVAATMPAAAIAVDRVLGSSSHHFEAIVR